MITMPMWLYILGLVIFLAFNLVVVVKAVKEAHKEGLIDNFFGFAMIPMTGLLGVVLAINWPLQIVIMVLGGLTYAGWKAYEHKTSKV